MSSKIIGLRLTSLRKQKKLTQEQVAEQTGIPRSTYSNYESGKREPDIETIKMLAQFNNVSVNYLLGETEDPTSKTYANPKLEANTAILAEMVKKYEFFDLSDPKKREVLEALLRAAAMSQSDRE
ncbi:helix-turn-helix domain-containing protein [Paenibacillus sp. S-38]|uniref:helix-turn-helix domain-containing protein n=1 Tax=Paenibacillus sp. S-38 TaxID=3416710 RepID=UPI003CFA3146